MDIFGGTDKTCYTVARTTGSVSAYLSLDGGGGVFPSMSVRYPAIVKSVQAVEGTNVQVLSCFDDVDYVYALGRKPGQVVVSVMGWAGTDGNGNSPVRTSTFGDALEFFERAEVGASGRSVSLFLNFDRRPTVIKGYLVDIQASVAQEEMSMVNVDFVLLRTSVHGGRRKRAGANKAGASPFGGIPPLSKPPPLVVPPLGSGQLRTRQEIQAEKNRNQERFNNRPSTIYPSDFRQFYGSGRAFRGVEPPTLLGGG